MKRKKNKFTIVDLLYIGWKITNPILQEVADIEAKKAKRERDYRRMIFHKFGKSALEVSDTIADLAYKNTKKKKGQRS